ncbi:MAG: F0F1 ATP synthase subunit alpha [Clostridia bacterium]|nr:F0F1 ATP synthase subunit alpha [Clostridia bacterium]MBQ8794882.1 F0F1 ATP synthase subunit alpha [Clostridia bacterium]
MIKSNFDETPEVKSNIVTVEIQCVTPPTEEQLSKMKDFFLAEYNADDIDFVIRKDLSVVGGFRIFVGDENYDWSTLGRIRQLRKSIQSVEKRNCPENIVSLIKEEIDNFELHIGHQQVGFVVSVGDGIALINGLREVEYGEIVLFDCGVKGMVQDIRSDGTNGVILFGDDSEIFEGSRVVRTQRTAGIPISTRILGRIIDPLGKPVDDGGEIGAKEYFPIERPAPGIIERKSVSTPMETGILAIDSMFPIGRGQRELIIGDRQTGKTTIATDTIINQKDKNVVCVYVAIGQKASSIAKVVATLKKHDAMDYTVVVSSPASDSASLQYIAPYAGCAVAEYFMYHGRDVLIVYDDLSKHAVAYRTLSLLLERSPGREAYPGDVFYLHSRLLERSAQLSDKFSGGSMTALPIVETQAGDVSAYIPTNIISITDGQIFLESELFFAGQRPAINVGLSVSRVGGAAQTNIMKKSVGTVRLDLAQYREMQAFSQFGGDLDAGTARQLKYGAGLMRLLRQSNNSPMTLHRQVITLICAQERLFVDIPEKDIKAVQQELLEYFEQNRSSVCVKIEHKKTYSDKLKNEIIETAKRFLASR